MGSRAARVILSWTRYGLRRQTVPEFPEKACQNFRNPQHRIFLVSNHNKIAAATNYVLRRHGALRMTELAERANLGLRQFERQFLRDVGVSPKTFARVARFQTALDAKISCPERRWVDIAHDYGYHDQMHMIHDFEKLGHNSPTQLINALGDNRPS